FFARGKRAVSFGKLRGNFIKSETIWTFSVASGKGAVSTIFLLIGYCTAPSGKANYSAFEVRRSIF
ncbi:hypothetical protein, partial [Psychrobacillus vulpis]|uniref:hypothetical protein n=1 Tax=Psychrobacillus vulpis TaxID=2325572 RepID=UPI001982016C